MAPQLVTQLSLVGSPRERGRQHGEALRDLIVEHQRRWEQVRGEETGLALEPYYQRLFAETDFGPAIHRLAPRLAEEVLGIAEGSGVDWRFVHVRSLSDEEPWFRRELGALNPAREGCTSIGIDANAHGPALVCQNMDMPRWCEGLQVLLRHSDPELPHAVYSFTLAGKLNLCGANSAGMAIMCNTISHLDHSRVGLPEDYVVRGFLEQEDFAAGLAFLDGAVHASGQNYTVGAPGHPVLNIEASAHSRVPWRPEPYRGVVYHANHPFSNPDTQQFDALLAASADAASLRARFDGTSLRRFASLQRHLKDVSTPKLHNIKNVFASHDGGICRHGNDPADPNVTVGCLIAELGDAPRLHLAPGPPCATPFLTVPLRS